MAVPFDPTQRRRRPRLLAIDDSMVTHRLLKARLRNEPLEVHGATSGAMGIELARTLQPEVILLDLDMAGMDGLEVLRQLKDQPQTHQIPVIFLSGSCSPETKIRCLDMGAIDFVSKPFNLSELLARVRSALRINLLIQMLAQRARIDGMTGLWNRAYFDERLEEELSIALRHDQPLSLILCDLDDFKTVNDTYGHPFGDEVLEEVARVLTESRAGDATCRYGGEEFAILLPRITVDEAAAVAERYREALRDRKWRYPELMVTASFGVADLGCVEQALGRLLVEAADRAMYQAKESGRDRVVVAPPAPRKLKCSA